MNSKTIYSHPFFGYETLSEMPHLVFRVLCAYLFDNADFFGLSENVRVSLLVAPNSGSSGIRSVASVLKSLECTYVTVQKHSFPERAFYNVEYFTTLRFRVSRHVQIS